MCLFIGICYYSIVMPFLKLVSSHWSSVAFLTRLVKSLCFPLSSFNFNMKTFMLLISCKSDSLSTEGLYLFSKCVPYQLTHMFSDLGWYTLFSFVIVNVDKNLHSICLLVSALLFDWFIIFFLILFLWYLDKIHQYVNVAELICYDINCYSQDPTYAELNNMISSCKRNYCKAN